ncbi:MAG TPA: flagellar filament capping protein FliD [Candidatus Bathyarchaeia archaeon]|nr:flagellar filament capping protein FliD [Candidatus Bathyarchaeia archaeon]
MATIQLGGLATGLDTTALINQLMSVEQQPLTLLQTSKLKLQAISTAFQDLNSRLATVQSRADALRDPETFFPRSVSSSAESVAAASASAGTARGTYTLSVSALARGSFAAAASTKGATSDVVAASRGTFQFRLGPGGAVVSIDVDATTTLDQLAKAVNDKGAGVRASVVNVGTTAAPAYQLTLASTATGAASNIVIVHDDTTLGVANTQAATDSSFTIAGIGSFTRSTNTFSDVLDGVTISLKASSGSTDLTVDFDNSGVQANVQGLLDAYNDVVKTIDLQSQITTDSNGSPQLGAFTGDIVPQMIRRSLASAIATPVAGSLSTLSQIGITTQRDGSLSMDTDKFQKAIAADPQAVSDLVAGTSSRDGVADLLFAKLQTMTQAVTGTIAEREDGLTSQITSLDKQIDATQSRLDQTRQMLEEKFQNLELVVSRIQTTGNALLAQLQALQNSSIQNRISGSNSSSARSSGSG